VISRRLPPPQFFDQRLQPFGTQANLHAIRREIARSTSSRTMRACSAGKSSSHSGAKAVPSVG
jgi:hypothetical protein